MCIYFGKHDKIYPDDKQPSSGRIRVIMHNDLCNAPSRDIMISGWYMTLPHRWYNSLDEVKDALCGAYPDRVRTIRETNPDSYSSNDQETHRWLYDLKQGIAMDKPQKIIIVSVLGTTILMYPKTTGEILIGETNQVVHLDWSKRTPVAYTSRGRIINTEDMAVEIYFD